MAQSNRPEPSEFLVFPIVDLDLMVFFRGSDITRPLYGSYKDFIKQLTKSITPASALLLQTNGVDNPTQSLLNLVAGTDISITDDGLGGITITATGGGGADARNGLILNSGFVELGGQTLGTGNLLRNSYITNDGFILRIDQTTGIGLDVRNALGTAVQAITDNGFAVRGRANSGIAIEGLAYDNVAGLFQVENADTSSVLPVLKLQRNSTGTVFNGMGGSMEIWLEPRITVPAPSPTVPTGTFEIEWLVSGSTVLSRRGQFNISLDKGDVKTRVMHGNANGEIFLDDYGAGTFVATPAYALGADATGKVVEFAVPSGGGVTSVGATLPITSSGGATPTISTSMSTNRLIGRGTAGTGVMEEISLGTNLSLSGTTLNAATPPMGLIPGSIVGSYACYNNSQSHEIVQVHDRLWVASTGNNRIDVYEASTGKLITGFTLANTVGVMYIQSIDEVWATLSSSGNIKRYNPITGVSAGADITGSGTSAVSYYEYSATKVFICNSGSNTITVVNPSTLAVDATITAGTLSITQPRNICYVDNVSSAHNGYITGISFGDNKLFAINAATNAVAITGVVVASFNAPTSIDYNPVNDRYYVASYSGSDLVVLNPATSTTVTFDTSFFGRNLRSVVCDKLTGFTYSASLCNNLSNLNGSVYLQCFDTNGIKWATVTPCDAVATSYFYGYLSIDTVGKFLYCNAVSLLTGKNSLIRVKI
jgi:YVTN family beta-propeller protein